MASSDSLSQPPLKNRKTVEGCFSSVETDRISMLPDDVICHILSFIPTKYSIRTSVLSKRWKNLWALSPNLVLEVFRGFLYAGFRNHFRKDDDIGNELRADSFVNSVDNLLLIRDCLHIENIKIFMSGKVLPSRVNFISWVYSIVMCTVRKLDIGVDFTATKDLGELSWCLFSCKTLVELKLSGRFVLNIPYYVCLPNLKTLVLKNVVYLGDSSIRKLLLGCPVLEDLEIERYEWDQMRTLYVSNSSLKRLKLYSCISGEVFYELGYAVDKKIVVDALNLEFIDIEDVWSGDIILKYVPNLVEAHITIELFEYTNNDLLLSNLLRSTAHVRRLYLSGVTLNILWYTEDPVLITFHNLVYLELYLSTRGLIQLMSLLRSCPKLEALFLPGGIDCEDDDGGVDNEFLENDPEQVPYCLRQSLKTVEIRRFVGEKFELNIVRYLLGNALVLKTMTIVWWWPPSDLDFVEIQTELTNFPRLSNDCKIVLLYR